MFDFDYFLDMLNDIAFAEWLSFCHYMRKRKIKTANMHYWKYCQTKRIIRLLKKQI